MGYRGAISTVRQDVRRIECEGAGTAPRAASGDAGPRAEFASPSRLAALKLIRPCDRPSEVQQALDALSAGDDSIRCAIESAEEFAVVIRGRRPDALTGWLTRAEGSSASELRTLARELRPDEAALRAGIESPWSNGPVEGRVNRLKLIERSMHRRAGFDLIRARVLDAG
ncbi:transposase [Paludisphaera mucosa]|uniref:transposase n=1 Tax=Paludisphaera mucosa TaxID=3030827 RepID=UPI0034A4EF9F